MYARCRCRTLDEASLQLQRDDGRPVTDADLPETMATDHQPATERVVGHRRRFVLPVQHAVGHDLGTESVSDLLKFFFKEAAYDLVAQRQSRLLPLRKRACGKRTPKQRTTLDDGILDILVGEKLRHGHAVHGAPPC